MATDNWMFDLDGVVWLANDAIPGSAEALGRLAESGRTVTFFTNNSFSRRADLLAKFASHGIACSDEQLYSSAEAAAYLLEPGESAYVLGGGGIEEALLARGVELVGTEAISGGATVDAVLVGLDLTLQFARLTAAVRAIAAGARLVGTNDDATYPTPDGPLPGGGSLLAAVAYASGATPVVAGKPYEPAAELVRRRLGEVAVMVGDRPETDGRFAERLGAKYAMVRSGVTPPGTVVDNPVPDFDALNLAALADEILGGKK
ncbi:MAG TPA: HAD-IIA family hydrolase [Acidimicrobiales bacterium]